MTPETLCDTNEMNEITNLAETLISSGATLEQIVFALQTAIDQLVAQYLWRDEMKVKDLILELQQIYDQEKEVFFGNVPDDIENRISGVTEKEFQVFIKEYQTNTTLRSER